MPLKHHIYKREKNGLHVVLATIIVSLDLLKNEEEFLIFANTYRFIELCSILV
jgi:hypothetical protein